MAGPLLLSRLLQQVNSTHRPLMLTTQLCHTIDCQRSWSLMEQPKCSSVCSSALCATASSPTIESSRRLGLARMKVLNGVDPYARSFKSFYLPLMAIRLSTGEVIEYAKKKAVTEAYKNAFQSMAIILLRSGKVALHFLGV